MAKSKTTKRGLNKDDEAARARRNKRWQASDRRWRRESDSSLVGAGLVKTRLALFEKQAPRIRRAIEQERERQTASRVANRNQRNLDLERSKISTQWEYAEIGDRVIKRETKRQRKSHLMPTDVHRERIIKAICQRRLARRAALMAKGKVAQKGGAPGGPRGYRRDWKSEVKC